MIQSCLLNELQQVLARLIDAPIYYPVAEFHIGERAHCAALMQRPLRSDEDEQVLFSEHNQDTAMSVYVDEQVLIRLKNNNPLGLLNEHNFADFCTALEGVSHFHYLAWCVEHGRQVSLFELELQAEVDKYAVAMYLLRHQGQRDLPTGLCRRLFDVVGYVMGLSSEALQRYHDANRYAAQYCQRLNRHLVQQRFRPEVWVRSLREFYRLSQQGKLQRALS